MTETEKTWQLHKPRGEWRLCGTGSMAELREDGRTIAYPAFCSSDAESDNRLALMAAAPELLNAVQLLLTWNTETPLGEDRKTYRPFWDDVICAARAAISKAGV